LDIGALIESSTISPIIKTVLVIINYGATMKGWHILLMPGDFVARKLDKNYVKFVGRIALETKKGDRRLAIYSLLARLECILAFVVGASASYFGFVIVIPLVLCIYPLIALGDPRV